MWEMGDTLISFQKHEQIITVPDDEDLKLYDLFSADVIKKQVLGNIPILFEKDPETGVTTAKLAFYVLTPGEVEIIRAMFNERRVNG